MGVPKASLTPGNHHDDEDDDNNMVNMFNMQCFFFEFGTFKTVCSNMDDENFFDSENQARRWKKNIIRIWYPIKSHRDITGEYWPTCLHLLDERLN